jgi:hypothetical protein
MLSRIRDRLRHLEDKIAAKGRHLVFVHFEEPDASPRDEQLAAYKAEHSIAPSETIHEVSINFA